MKHYVAKDNGPTPHVNWVNQWFTLFDWNQNIKFFKVNKDDTPVPTNQPIKSGCNGQIKELYHI